MLALSADLCCCGCTRVRHASLSLLHVHACMRCVIAVQGLSHPPTPTSARRCQGRQCHSWRPIAIEVAAQDLTHNGHAPLLHCLGAICTTHSAPPRFCSTPAFTTAPLSLTKLILNPPLARSDDTLFVENCGRATLCKFGQHPPAPNFSIVCSHVSTLHRHMRAHMHIHTCTHTRTHKCKHTHMHALTNTQLHSTQHTCVPPHLPAAGRACRIRPRPQPLRPHPPRAHATPVSSPCRLPLQLPRTLPPLRAPPPLQHVHLLESSSLALTSLRQQPCSKAGVAAQERCTVATVLMRGEMRDAACEPMPTGSAALACTSCAPPP